MPEEEDLKSSGINERGFVRGILVLILALLVVGAGLLYFYEKHVHRERLPLY